MTYSGKLYKMDTELTDPVQYSMVLDDQKILLNPAIGQSLTLRWNGSINCVHCNRKTNKSFSQGYCYPCFTSLAQCDMCIMKPEQCHYDQGTCREPEWGEAHCLQPHFVYLANSSGIKVGITRHTQIPTRWIDQGAVSALQVMQVSSRRASGLMEVAFKNHVADKTSWQRMLKGSPEPVDLLTKRDELLELIEEHRINTVNELGEDAVTLLPDAEQVDIHFPVTEYPTKVKSHNFDKTPEVGGTLMGIKGQYLLFDTGVINVRKFGGYQITLESSAL